MSDIFDISISALQAFQNALNVTGNNIANANTPGYSRQSVELATRVPQFTGGGWIGSGVNLVSVTRAFDQASTSQYNNSQSALGQLNGLKIYTDQFDNLFSGKAGGISSALSGFFGAASDVANDPTSTAARTAFIGKAQTLAYSLQSASQQLDAAESDINVRLTADVAQVNTYAQSIARLNAQIAIAGAGGQGQQPNDLLDQRDQLVTQLSKLVGVTTTTDTNGALNVFVGSGQALVLQGNAYGLTTLPNPFEPHRLEIGISSAGNNAISSGLRSGEIGGLLAARTQVIDPVRGQLGQLATAVAQSANQQQAQGLDLNGNLGAALFSLAGPQTAASSRNTGTASVTASIASLGGLTASRYQLTYSGGAYTLTRESDGSVVSTTGSGTVASPLQADGLSLVISGTPANGDQFRIDPTGAAAGSIAVTLTSTAQVAAAGAIRTSAASGNAGSGTISAGSVVDPANPGLFTTATISFTSATTYSIDGSGSFTYTPGADIIQNGWKVQISGTPASGDSFTVQRNLSGSGDNRNALALAALQNQGVLTNGTVSISGALGSLVTGIGSIAQQTTQAQTAQSAVNSSALQTLQSKSGVNLDEEAAAMLQWQQAYQAAAQALKIGSSLFDTLIAAVRAG